jgi:hypothetical protein
MPDVSTALTRKHWRAKAADFHRMVTCRRAASLASGATESSIKNHPSAGSVMLSARALARIENARRGRIAIDCGPCSCPAYLCSNARATVGV